MITLTRLDRTILRKNEIGASFTAIEDALPVARGSYTKDMVELRNILEPKVFLSTNFGYPNEVTFVADSTATYYIIEESALSHECTISAASNKDSDSGNAVIVLAYVHGIYNQDVPGGVTNFYIACSEDNGVSWEVIQSTKRFVGPHSGRTDHVYTSNYESNDYMGNVGWNRPNMPWDSMIIVMAVLGGDGKHTTSNGKNKYAVAIDNNSPLMTGNYPRLTGTIMVHARV